MGLSYADTQWTLPANATPEEKAWADKGLSWQTRLWIDDMFMITILQAQAYHTTGKREYMDRAVKEMVVYLDELQRPNGLFYHAPDVPYFWARGNGWMAVGMAELLLSTPEDNPNHARILEGYRLMMKSLKDYQDKSGMWNQLIDKADCWPETSGSAMFTYAMIMGVKMGWLEAEEYGPIARKAWIALENAVKEGKVKSIGISNFDGERLVDLFNFADIKPSVIQVETHPYHQQVELQEFLKPYGTKIESWYPLGHGDKNLLEEKIFKKMAKKYNKTVAQIILRWHIQEGIIVFPRSTQKEHLAENINIFDFELSCSEIKEIRKLNKKQPYFTMTYEEQEKNFLSWKLED